MNRFITLDSSAGRIGAYESAPEGAPRGSLVLLQEIFGVNAHIRRVADRYAAAGYRVIAPALFDLVEPGVELGYGADDMTRAKALRAQVSNEQALAHVAAARLALGDQHKVGIVGYCWGGTIAWLAAARVPGLAAAVCYYGSGIAALADEVPLCPVQCHFGVHDATIPPADVEKIRAAHPSGVEIFVYDAGHGFNCDARGAYEPRSAATALARTEQFLGSHLQPGA